ncbi:MAG: 4Fe-4S dicluster domain-containing protein, partial [bacterium]
GSVDMLLIFGCNPVYNAPADMKFGDLISKVAFTVHLATHEDETSLKCLWHIPESHYLEAWGDARAFDGTATIMQPLILPLYATRSLHEVLDSMFASGRDGEEIVKSYWQKKAGVPDFNSWWRKSLNDGVVAGTAFSPKQVAASNVNWKFSSPASQGMEIIFRPDQSIHDGRFSNNPWLQELPKHISRVAWDNIALVSPSSAQKLGLELGDMMELTISGRSEKFPAWIMPGHPDESVTVYFGYGRTKAGKVGTGIGANAFALRSSDTIYFASGLQIKKTGKQVELASTQDHGSMEGRPIVREASITEFNAKPDFAQHMAHKPNQEQSFYPEYKYDGYKWAMTIDLNACVGCNACMIACVSENNIPVVGKSQVDNGREMHWIRIDRYYVGNDLDNPELVVMPVTCQHCENAPCEPVCPVLATQHDHEGLNVMTYNRCVGTRYCGDNCPYKVRRFNFLQYSDTTTKTFQLMRNPDVTVRNRGVMEKCSYCLQRISAARIEAKKDDRMIRDGEVVTACQSACPTQAIWFGDMNDKTSKIAELKADPRAYGLLEELNTKPRTSYLAKLRNPNPELVSENQANEPTHHG